MDLLTVSVTGYKRFRETTGLQTNGKLVALLGPNEAGKSSLLEAVRCLGDDAPIPHEAVARGMPADACRIVGRFFLDEADLVAADLTGPRCMIVTKTIDGRRTCRFDPPAPPRDVGHRVEFLELLALVMQDEARLSDVTVAMEGLELNLAALDEQMRSGRETFEVEVLDTLQALRNRLHAEFPDEPTGDAMALLIKINAVLEAEREPVPLQRAANALFPRVPVFLLFDEAARDLQTGYSISALSSGLPVALANLLDVAELSYVDLLDAVNRGDTSMITTLERRASRTLGRKFRDVWRQSGIDAALRIQGDQLEIQIVNQNEDFTSIAERSDGLKQFIALQAFAMRNHADRPVLLIDEAEQRLHYDAQADLVQMLARQTLAPKVIYTTHSAGCLPEDLGNGVRLVNPVGGTDSAVVNRFWRGDGSGLSPMLIGMGAGTLAFFPTRRAVLVEGAGDMLLYPTLFREVLGRSILGFQFVPGLSNLQRTMTPEALRDEKGVVYLVDSDPGGVRIANLLRRRGGVREADLFMVGVPDGVGLEVEDLIAPERLVAATNTIIAKWNPEAPQLETAMIGEQARMAALERAYRGVVGQPLPKVDVAYELLDMVSQDPQIRLVDPERLPILTEIVAGIVQRLEPAQVERGR